MRARKPLLIFWPQYFDLKRSRSDGRRLSKKLAIERITTKEIATAARRLGYKADVEGSFRYPKTWYDDPGRVVINAKGKKKSKILLEVAKEIRKMRSGG